MATKLVFLVLEQLQRLQLVNAIVSTPCFHFQILIPKISFLIIPNFLSVTTNFVNVWTASNWLDLSV